MWDRDCAAGKVSYQCVLRCENLLACWSDFERFKDYPRIIYLAVCVSVKFVEAKFSAYV